MHTHFQQGKKISIILHNGLKIIATFQSKGKDFVELEGFGKIEDRLIESFIIHTTDTNDKNTEERPKEQRRHKRQES